VFITHDQAETMEIADRVAILNAGRIEQVGAPNEIRELPAADSSARSWNNNEPRRVSRKRFGPVPTRTSSLPIRTATDRHGRARRDAPEHRRSLCERPSARAMEQPHG
jgi:ABC-type sulfate/molybdate transport systems ATPase subunit